jgi:hypothetical protein
MQAHARRRPRTIRPVPLVSRAHRSALLVIAAIVTAISAQSIHAFFLVDACLDAGGRYLGDPPRCEVGEGRFRRLRELPRRPGWWIAVFGPALLAGGIAYGVGRVVVRQARRA